jgi:hypothetical protein
MKKRYKSIDLGSDEVIQKSVISHNELDKFTQSRYKVTTVIPYVEKPQINVRMLNQEGLDDFLENYNEFAEFLIDISIVEK